ncbi:MAG: hypothetical protein G8237_02255 [Magnetococcales bacterium]|nr:hypothetical protein [Magnetococcales bacterium]
MAQVACIQPTGFIPFTAINLALTGGAIALMESDFPKHFLNPMVVATVHLYVLGVLTLSLTGLAIRHLPEWAGSGWPKPALHSWIVWSLLVGAWSVFLGIGTDIHRWFLLSASAGVGVAIPIFVVQMALLLWRSRRRDGIMALLTLATLSLTGVFLLGAMFLGEYAHGFLAHDRLALLGTHLTWGIFGWAGVILWVMRITGNTASRNAPASGWFAGLLITWILVPVTLFQFPDQPLWVRLAAVPGMLSWGIWTLHARHLESWHHHRYWWSADLFGVLALLTWLLWPLWPDDRWPLLFGVLILPGWTLSQLLGTMSALRPDAIPGNRGWLLHMLAVVLLATSLFTTSTALWQSGGVVLMISAMVWIFSDRNLGQHSHG